MPVCRAQQACVTHLSELSPTKFAFPKFYRMPFYKRGIKAFGSVDLTSTGFGERSHALIKNAMRFTNRHGSDAINAQVKLYTPYESWSEHVSHSLCHCQLHACITHAVPARSAGN